jgi:hypothetical protein
LPIIVVLQNIYYDYCTFIAIEKKYQLKGNWCLINMLCYLLLAPAITVSAPAGIVGLAMQWAALRTNLVLRRVPPQVNSLSTNIKICHGLEWTGASTTPPTIRSYSKSMLVC